MPSQAAAAILPWPSAAIPAAIAIAKPEVSATQLTPAAPPAAAGSPCAKTGVASIRIAITENSTNIFLLIVIAPSDFAASGWLTFHAMGGPHACGVLQNS